MHPSRRHSRETPEHICYSVRRVCISIPPSIELNERQERSIYIKHNTHQKPPRMEPLVLLACLALYSCVSPVEASHTISPRQANTSDISWWTCPDVPATQCAYLTVPRDYSKPDANETVSIFLRRIPAAVSAQDRLGSIITNPGGPGGSGSGFVVSFGPALSALTDGRYDIVGFDPRGVNMTLPPMGCYPTEAHGLHLAYQEALLGTPFEARGVESLPAAVRAATERAFFIKLNATQEALYDACKTSGNKATLEAMTTALVARDIDRISEVLGDEGINYWGVSYGTVLGATLAAMKPQRIRRMLLDGVCDSEAYHRDPFRFVHNDLADSQKVLTGFFDSCVVAGPERCAFAKKNQTSSKLQSRLDALYERLRAQPLPVSTSPAGPGILTASALRAVMVQALYAPAIWPMVAQVLADVERGDGVGAYTIVYGRFVDIHPQAPDENVFNRYMERTQLVTTAAGILCSDTRPTPKSLDNFIKYVHNLSTFTPIGEEFSFLPWQCTHWNITPVERYDGPWGVAEGLKKTSYPILFTSLNADPVAPLSAAVKMTKAFGNQSAALLVQEGFGHATIAHPSLCTAKVLHDYFVQGTIPTPGTVCKPEPGYLFPENNTSSTSKSKREYVGDMSGTDRGLLAALEDMSNALAAQLRQSAGV
ncbi:alpha/beta-hydrolase [Ceratobasidium sp. AG-I]|nr:alpha/beta-hydrolase [Ceratobasidium sp. AG-I]